MHDVASAKAANGRDEAAFLQTCCDREGPVNAGGAGQGDGDADKREKKLGVQGVSLTGWQV
ncbi:hypothetical protein QFZ61_000852 [Arthrobacter sp. B3I4]|nr:hypothetical protein [Arthrobacter sp. B3I4]